MLHARHAPVEDLVVCSYAVLETSEPLSYDARNQQAGSSSPLSCARRTESVSLAIRLFRCFPRVWYVQSGSTTFSQAGRHCFNRK